MVLFYNVYKFQIKSMAWNNWLNMFHQFIQLTLWKQKLTIGVCFYLKIKHYSCLTNYVKLFFHLANSVETFYSNVLLFLRPPSRESHNTQIRSCSLPPSPACLWIQNLRRWSWERGWPREGGAGAHLMIFPSFFILTSLLCSKFSWKFSWSFALPPSVSPRSSREPLTAFPLLPYHSDSPTPIHATHFCFNFPFLCITNKTLPNASRFSGELPICWGGRKVKDTILAACFEAAEWPPMSKQESDCWTCSGQAEETPAKSKTRSPVSPLCLGLQWPALQT